MPPALSRGKPAIYRYERQMRGPAAAPPESSADYSRALFAVLDPTAETCQLVQELAGLTGETQTMAVTIAVRERLEKVRHLSEAGLADRFLTIGRDAAPRPRKPFRTADHGDLLYDERGLPA